MFLQRILGRQEGKLTVEYCHLLSIKNQVKSVLLEKKIMNKSLFLPLSLMA